MTDETKPIPGTYGAIVRSETPMPWRRRMLKGVTFTPEEWATDPGVTLARVVRNAAALVKDVPE